MNYIVYPVKGLIEGYECDGEIGIDKLHSLVEGYYERVTRHGKIFWVNEEGKLRGLAQNPYLPEFVGNVVEEVS